ncbi:hypothetical protein TWF694_006643 [Orbilia ellipsospora]|uniref:Uncharacterized protein n=1 Tax=Orbilia ellipsospora TaxID=2528407 RepID=A0AAV9XNB2_9PEZI
MCKSVCNFQCAHMAVAEPLPLPHGVLNSCPCGRFKDRIVVTVLCPACKLFTKAQINSVQLSWLIEQQKNTAELLMESEFGILPLPDPPVIPPSASVHQQPTPTNIKASRLPNKGILPPQEAYGKQFPEFRTYAAAVRGPAQQHHRGGGGGGGGGGGAPDELQGNQNRGYRNNKQK